jgi:hypothetical protein
MTNSFCQLLTEFILKDIMDKKILDFSQKDIYGGK